MLIKLDNPKLFGNLAAEDEDIELLESYFVDKPEYMYFRSNEKLWIVRAKKGMGKSALLKKVAHEKSTLNNEDIIIEVKGSDIIRNGLTTSGDVQQLIYSWQTAICSRVAVEIGKNIELAFSDDSITLVENSELEGFKEKNLVGSLIERMKRKIGSIEVDKPKITNAITLLERYQEKKGRSVWLFIDDIDATFKNSEEETRRLSSFFTACRYLIQNVSGLHIRVSVRTDVWAVIADKDEALDKVDQPQYMMDLNWSEMEVKNIVANRIRSYIVANIPEHPLYEQLLNPEQDKKQLDLLMDQVFKSVMPWGAGRRKPSVIIYTLSNRRPRWAIHLCFLAGKAAARKGKNKIGIDELTENLDDYGKRRITDIVREHEHQSQNIRDFINAFAKKKVRYTTEELLKLIREDILQNIRPSIAGVVGEPSDMDIAHFMFRMGLITAREDLVGSEYKHYHFEDDHTLLNSSVNPDKGFTWEIHPSFRTALRAAQSEGVILIDDLPNLSDLQKGIVKWFDSKKGFGFIDIGQEKDIFVHFSAIVGSGYRKLEDGQQVEFNVVRTDRGLHAENVVIT